MGCVQRYRFSGGMGVCNPLASTPVFTLPDVASTSTFTPTNAAAASVCVIPTPVHTTVKRALNVKPWESNGQESLSSFEDEDDDEFESAPSYEKLEVYEHLQRTTMQMLEKAQGVRTTKLERRATRLKNMINELHADLHIQQCPFKM